MGWEMTCIGRSASGERFDSGELRQRTEVWQHGRRLWSEYARLAGDDPMLASKAGLAGCSVSATLIAAGREIPKDLLEQCRGIAPEAGGRAGITLLPRLLLARYLGHSSEAAMHYFIALWPRCGRRSQGAARCRRASGQHESGSIFSMPS